MKKYSGLKVMVIPFTDNAVIATSMPGSCIQIVANTTTPGSQVCMNPSDTTSYMYIGDNPFGD